MLPLVLLNLLCFLARVQSQQTFPYIAFMGHEVLANHSSVDISLVGVEADGSNSVLCITDLSTCCSGANGPHRGDWYFPDGTRLPFAVLGSDVYETRIAEGVELRRWNPSTTSPPSGIYRCDIPTNAVHDDTDISVRDTVYVGVYTASGGMTTEPKPGMSLKYEIIDTSYSDSPTRSSALSLARFTFIVLPHYYDWVTPKWVFRDSPEVFGIGILAIGSITINVGILRNGNILTCISTGGPATTVTWTRDSTTITQGTETVLVDPVTAQYNHTLHVVGSSRGSYTCTVSNNKPSSASASIDIRGTSLNVILGLPTIGATWIYLPWEISELDENLYSIVWDGNPSVRCPGVGGGREDSIRNTLGSYNITGLEEDSRYIFVVRVSNIEGQTSSLTDTATTLEAVPATSPAGLNVSSVSDISITVCWEELPCFDQNGHITGYSVRHGEVGTNISATINVPDGGGNHQTSISGLIPSTEYWIQVAAVNSAGTGDYSDFIVQETDGVDCGDPPGLINGRFTASFINTTYNSTVTYECIEGFNLHGADSRTCFASGNWSGEDSFCKAATAAASVCGGITCWLSAVALAAIFSSVVIVLLLLVCLTVTGCVVRQRTKKPAALSPYAESRDVVSIPLHYTAPNIGNVPDVPPSQVQLLTEDLRAKNMLFPKSHIQLGKVIGQGESGLVYRGYLKDGGAANTLVAIKTGKALLAEDDKERLLKEVSLMLTFNHPNVMQLIGLSFDGETPLLIMPFMLKGNVLEYVREHREILFITDPKEHKQVEASRKTCLGMCYQISKGMSYLANFKFIHRDLAARNCMIDGNDVIKVSDFGLTEDMYNSDYYRHSSSQTGNKEKIPIKWMSPESIETNIFDEKTDVWSFGVTCWEVFTCGGVPYAGVPVTILLRELRSGYRLDKPSNISCSDDIWAVVVSCWSASPEKRPKFAALVNTLTELLDSDPSYIKLSRES